MTRRELLVLIGSAVAAAGAAPRARASGAAQGRPEPFSLRDVRLTGGPFFDAQQRNLAYLLSLQPDRMLHNFRVNASLEPKAPVYGGWESEEPWVSIRCHGHTLGHYLTAASLMYASTGDARLRERVDVIVGELQECQRASRDGLVCAFPDGAAQLENAIAGRRFVGVPWYTMHKVLAGVRDAHLFAGSTPALDVFSRLAAWAAAATAPMSDEGMQRMLAVEHGGMNEVLADAAALVGDARYLAVSRRFCHDALLSPLADAHDPLDGLHANTQIPKVVGFQRLSELTGDDRLRRASHFFWRTVVGSRSFVTGGHGDNEHFFPPADFASHLQSAKTMETCCTHNMLRLTRALFVDRPAAALFDYYERALYNGILASQDPESGMNTYFQATRPGYVRLFHTPDRSFWCCTGTGMENHAKHGDSIYFRRGSTLWVNLFMPSTLAWSDLGLVVRQSTAFPAGNSTRLQLTAARPVVATIRLRQPEWCVAMTVAVNGRRWKGRAEDDGYVAITREWRNGDRVEVELPMQLRIETLPGTRDVIAFLYGPIVLAGRLGREGLEPGNQIIVNERTSGSMLNVSLQVPELAGEPASLSARIRQDRHDPLVFRTAGVGRPHDVDLAPFYRLAHERYNLYWKVVPS
jgi:uncharacterized protein